MKRRQFMEAGVLGALAFFLPPIIFAADKRQKFKIGMAATTWLSTTPSLASYWTATEEISRLNIGATEADNSIAKFDVAYPNGTGDFRERSMKTGVRLMGVYQALWLHDAQKLPEMRAKIHSVASFLKQVHAEYIALGWDVPASGGKLYQRTPEDVTRTVRAMDELGRISWEEHGIFAAFHAERDIPKEMILRILDQTNPKYIRLCADVGHFTAAGLDAVQTVKTYASRLAVSHWKDYDPKLPGPAYLGSEAVGDFVELGKGVVDFRGLADLYRQIEFDGWVQLELDHTREASIAVSAGGMKSFVVKDLKLQLYAVRR
ncbi:MAG: sugar phosphate isomerase/epimerase [Candidatus Sulfotelmatobacter sp.]